MKKESQNDWWLAASTTGPWVGDVLPALDRTRHRTKKIGVRIALSTQYVTHAKGTPAVAAARTGPRVLNFGAGLHRGRCAM